MYRVITPLKRNAPSNFFYYAKLLTLNLGNLLFEDFYDDYWYYYKHITGYFKYIDWADNAPSSVFSVFMSLG